MSAEGGHGDQIPIWTVLPNDTDWTAWIAVITIGLAVYFIMYLYAKFDRWAEHKSEGTPLAKTIPTLLAIALLYEIFPLDHFHILLPASAILIALMADWMRFQSGESDTGVEEEPVIADQPNPEVIDAEVEEPANV